MVFSIVFYNCLLFFSTLTAYLVRVLNQKAIRNIILIISFLTLLIPASLRYGIGTDYFNYENIFIRISDGIEDVETEPFYWGINSFVALFGGGFQWVVAITSFLFIFFIYCSFNYKNLVLGVFFSVLIMYSDSFNTIRQILAVAISLYGTSLLLSNKNYGLLAFFCLIIFGTMFHSSCVFGLVIPILMRVKIPRNVGIAMLLGIWFLAPILVSHIFDFPLLALTSYGNYANELDYSASAKLGSGLGLVIQIIPSIIILVFSKSIFEKHKNSNFYINSAWFFIVIKIMAVYLVILYRFVDYFDFMYVLLMVEICRLYAKSWLNLFVASFCILLNLMFFELNLINNMNEIVPYKMFDLF